VKTLSVFEVASGRKLGQSPIQVSVRQIVFSPDSRAIVVVNPDFTLDLLKRAN
jgi:hypothetical protein